MGIPKEILTDQGTAFMSPTLSKLYELLGIKSIRTSVYHPQTDGLVDRFNRTSKSIVRKFLKEDLLFAVWEVPQASTGFSLFELLYSRQPRGVLDIIREAWEEGPSYSRSEIQYDMDLRAKLRTLGRLSMENLLQAQDKQSRLYNRGTRACQFTLGEKVLVLLPTSSILKYSRSGKDRLWLHGHIFTPARSHESHTAPHRNEPRGSGAQLPLSFIETQKKWFRMN